MNKNSGYILATKTLRTNRIVRIINHKTHIKRTNNTLYKRLYECKRRVRIVAEIYLEMRKQVGDDFPIIVRLSGNEYVHGGRTEAETYELCTIFEELGFDGIHISNGSYASPGNRAVIAPMFTEHALNMEISAQVKKLVDLPVIVTNRINDPQMADTLINMDKADFIGMGRGSLTDPDLPNKCTRTASGS